MAAPSNWVPVGGDPSPLELNKSKPIKLTTIDKIGGIYCSICKITFGNKKSYDSHYVEHGQGNATIMYTCVVCHKEIAGYPSFRGHCYLKHVMKDKFKCEHCEKVFSKLCVLKSHIETMHKYIPHECVTCNMQFKNKKELSIHQNVVHKRQGPYDCETCGEKLNSTDDCEQHIEDHCNITYACPICEETIPDIKEITSHMIKHFGDVLTKDQDDDDEEPTEIKNDSTLDLLGGIFCCICDDTYKTRSEFDNHYMLDHIGEPIVYACNICGKDFEKYQIFANHCYNHYAKGRFQCEACSKCFPRLSLLVSHMEAHHAEVDSDAEPTFTCRECGAAYKSQRRLKDHQRAAHNISYHQCPDKKCMKLFGSARELASHRALHARGGRRCGLCGLRLRSAAAAARHAPLHRRAAWACPVCARPYADKYLVLRHVPTHFCKVLHVCTVCGKAYNARSRLNFHMKVHMPERDYKCPHCGKGFTKKYLLQQHVNIHTGLRPYSCTVCSKSFNSQPNMTKHMKCMHNITVKMTSNPEKTKPNPNTKIEKMTNITNDHNGPKDSSNVTLDNNNASIELDSAKIASEDVLNYETPSFDDSDESGWRSDGIDPSVLDMLEENLGSMDAAAAATDITELENALWAPSQTISASPLSFLSPAGPAPATTVAATVPCEYGPEFVNFAAEAGAAAGAQYIQLDDLPLPHIDPLLTLTPAARPVLHAHCERPAAALPAWEPPILAKLCPDQLDLDRYSFLDADVF